MTGDRHEDDRHDGGRRDDDERRDRAEELAEEAEIENPDPHTRREALEQALEEEDLSEEGEDLGSHNT